MRETDDFVEDEVSLFDLLDKLKDGWHWILGGLFIGVFGAAMVIFITPNQYEAIAIVQVGQVGQVAQVGQVGQVAQAGQAGPVGQARQVGQVSSMPVEPPGQAVERMKSLAFQSRVAQEIEDSSWAEVLRNGGNTNAIAVSSPKGALSLIDLTVKGGSPEAAKRIASAVIEELAKRHAEIAKPAVDRLALERSLARERLKGAESDLVALSKLVVSTPVKDDRFTQLSLMTNLRMQKEAEIFYQRQMLSALEGALIPPNTQPAQAIEAVFVREKPVSPKKGLLLALGSVGGLLMGVMWVFFRGAWRQARNGRPNGELQG